MPRDTDVSTLGYSGTVGSSSFGTRLKIIGVIEVLGGLSGCATVSWFFLEQGYSGGAEENIALTIIPFLVLTAAGIGLLKSRQVALQISLAMQGAQVLTWALAGTMWKFSAGPFVSLTIMDDKASFFVGWNTSWGFGRIPAATPAVLSLNLIPTVFAFILWHRLRIQSGSPGMKL